MIFLEFFADFRWIISIWQSSKGGFSKLAIENVDFYNFDEILSFVRIFQSWNSWLIGMLILVKNH